MDFCDINNSLDVIMTADKVTYMYCPISDYSAIVDNGIITVVGGVPVCSNKQVKVVEYGEGHFDILFNTEMVAKVSNNNIVNQRNIADGLIMVSNAGVGVVDLIKGGKVVSRESLVAEIDVAQIDDNGSVAVVVMCLKNGKRAVVVMDTHSGVTKFKQVADSIDCTGDTIKCLTDMRNILGLGKVVEYKNSSGELSEYSVYLYKDREVANDLVVPYAFLLAVQSKNFAIAKKYLAGSFENVQDLQLANYFGDFSSIHYNAYNTDDKILYVTMGEVAKHYEFLVEGGKIIDIRLVEK